MAAEIVEQVCVGIENRRQGSPPCAVWGELGAKLCEDSRGVGTSLVRPTDIGIMSGAWNGLSKRELVDQELGRLTESDFDRLLEFMRLLSEEHADATVPTVAAESLLAKDWLSPEEDAAWANL